MINTVEAPEDYEAPINNCSRRSPDVLPALRPKQALFAREYTVDRNALQAAKRAGYSKKTAGQAGHHLLKVPKVVAEIERLNAETSRQLGIDRDIVIKGLLRAVAEARRQSEPALAILAWREIGLMLGFYSPGPAKGIGRDMRSIKRYGPRRKELYEFDEEELQTMSMNELVALVDEGGEA